MERVKGKLAKARPFQGSLGTASRRNLRLPNPLLGFASAPAVPIKNFRRRSFLLERVKGKLAKARPFQGSLGTASRRNLRLPNPLFGFASAPAVPIKNLPKEVFFIGAGEGNRTLVVSLGSFCSTIELHPHA